MKQIALFVLLCTFRWGQVTSQAPAGKCATKGGPVTAAPCVFPFKFKGKTYTSCTCVDSNLGDPWCSTKVDPASLNHVQGNWGLCDTTATAGNCGIKCPTQNALVSKIFSGSLTDLTCPSGLNLVSCGIANKDYGPRGTITPLRGVILTNNTSSCSCTDYYGANCTAWCTNRSPGITLVSLKREKLSPTAVVTCPTGQKVAGCYCNVYNLSASDSYAVARFAFPSADGSSCTCSHDRAYTCYAACAPIVNIVNYEVRSVASKGNVTVTCSAGNTVLGCGYACAYSPFDVNRVYTVSGDNACDCFDEKGVTCYAMCGQLQG